MKTKYNLINSESPTYFIADIAANHDGELKRALDLIELAAENGANAAKFQNFRAATIVSKTGFEKDLSSKLSHQKEWSKSVFEVYESAELPLEWTGALVEKCNEVGIDYFTAPYDLEYVDFFADKMPFYKVGSGDITYKEILEKIASKKAPVMLATGASSMHEVQRAVEILERNECEYVVMQCNTNYTGEQENFKNINLKVLEEYKKVFPKAILGLSDHTPGFVTVLGAVALGAKAIEKHFTDDPKRNGPDHKFSMNPTAWREMVNQTRLLEAALGDGIKKIEQNETESSIIQRRALRTNRSLKAGHTLSRNDLIALRPIPAEGIEPFRIDEVVGRRIKLDLDQDSLITLDLLMWIWLAIEVETNQFTIWDL